MREAGNYSSRRSRSIRSHALPGRSRQSAAWFSVRYAHEKETLARGARRSEARRALEQDPLLADAHLAIAAQRALSTAFNWKIVLERTSEALALDPPPILAHVARMRGLLSSRLVRRGRERPGWRVR